MLRELFSYYYQSALPFVCVQNLLSAGAEVEAENLSGKTALHWATSNRDKEMMDLLRKAGNGNGP